MLDSLSHSQTSVDGIAIIGMVVRAPNASNLSEFWDILIQEREGISTIDPEQIPSTEPLQDPDYVKRRGIFKEDPTLFDADFFQMSPREAEATDPQQRLFLEAAYHALEDAGIDPTRHAGLIGVFAGMSNNSYFQSQVEFNQPLREALGGESINVANGADYLATRTAYKLNLKGPALNLYTACSTSLVAVAQAVQNLNTFGCDVALAGGISVKFPQERGYLHQEGSIYSPDGHCRPFDAKAAGTLFSNGLGIVVLKRLSDAIADQDRIYAVLKGAALNNDGGDKVSFSAPSVNGHTEVIALAQALADFHPQSISYVECHGTATPIGDPIEIAGLTEAFRQGGAEGSNFCGIGSLKSNFGHMDAASGVVGLIKTALCLQEKTLPASLHFRKANPALNLETSPFYVANTTKPWENVPLPRRAGVSSFGVGGTNAHVVLEEAPELTPTEGSRDYYFLPLSAKDAKANAAQCAALAALLESQPTLSLASVSSTLVHGRSRHAFRSAIVATSLAEAVEALKSPATGHAPLEGKPIAFLFSGQGSQREHMEDHLVEQSEIYRKTIAQLPLAAVDNIHDTAAAQPALFRHSYAQALAWQAEGLQPAEYLGHSIGEYVAATLAGVFSPETALELVKRRGELMQACPAGVMLSVRMAEAELRAILPAELDLCVVNGPTACVVGGPEEAIDDFSATLTVANKKLKTSHAFHSRMMDAALEPFKQAVKAALPQEPRFLWISNLTGQRITREQAMDSQYWADHLRNTVLFSAGLMTLGLDYHFVEVGPGTTLTQLAKQHGYSATATEDSLRKAKAHLWCQGVDVLSQNVDRTVPVSLPLYPFTRQRFCAETSLPAGTRRVGETQLQPGSGGAAPQKIPAVNTTSGTPDTLTALRALLSKASGLDLTTANETASFLELGLDSLFLTQAGTLIRKHFGVKVTFRQISEDLSTLQSLADYLKEHQTEVPQPQANQVAQKNGISLAGKSQAVATGRISFGPFRPMQTDNDGGLTDSQTQHLRDLINAYTTKTGKSKAHTQRYRDVLADPRAASGFNPLWKEAVYPLVINRSRGGRLWDVDDNEFIDITLGFGVGFLGHNPPYVVQAVEQQLHTGFEIGPTSPLAGEVAQMLVEWTGLERVTFCNTGSEALIAAIRLSRTVSGREKIVMFAGAYHGIMDEVLARPALDGEQLHTMPIAPGIPEASVEKVIVLEYGNPDSLKLIAENGQDIAAVLVETVQSRRPELQPAAFLKELRQITAAEGIALVLDEVVNGFRIHPRGAAGWFDVEPDIATYGKVIGGGLPIGVVAGKRTYMDALDGGHWQYGDASGPSVGVTFFAGTFVRHPLALAAAKAVLTHLKEQGPQLQERMNARMVALVAELNGFCESVGAPIRLTTFSSWFIINFAPHLRHTDLLYTHMRLRGVHIWPGRCGFLCTQHTEEDVQKIIAVFKESVIALQQASFLPSKASLPSCPATAAQKELYFTSQLSPQAEQSCHEQLTLQIKGELTRSQIDSALAVLVRRHESLRGFFPDGPTKMMIADAWPQAPKASSPPHFDITTGPLFQTQVQQTEASTWEVQLHAHHIICDGWSFGILCHELAHLLEGKPEADLPPADSFQTHARTLVDSSIAKAFWKDQLTPAPQPLLLPQDLVGPDTGDLATGFVTARLTPQQSEELKHFAKSHNLTPNQVLLGLWQLLMARLTGNHDFVTAIPVAAQASSGMHHLVGHCVQFLPIRFQPLEKNGSVLALFKKTKSTLLSALEHAELTLGEMLELTQLPAEARQLISANAFSFETMTDPPSGQGLSMTQHVLPKRYQSFHLIGYTYQHPEEFRFLLNYRQELFQPGTIQRWAEHFLHLISETLKDAQQPAERMPLATHSLASYLRSQRVPQPATNDTLVSRFLQATRIYAERTAVTAPSLSYAELDAQSTGIALHLLANGVKRNQLVAITLERTPDLLVAILGILKAGAAYLPIDLSYPKDRLAFMLEDSGAEIMLAHRSLQTQLPEHSGKTLYMEELRSALATPPALPTPQPEDLAYCIYTSGSTGKPKGCLITHRNVVRLMDETHAWFGFDETDVWSLFHSAAFDFSVWEIWGPLFYGGKLAVVPFLTSRDPDAFWQLIQEQGITVLNQTPSAFKHLADAALKASSQAITPLRHIIFGGEALEMASLRPWFDRFGDASPRLINMYGITETTVHVTYRHITAADLTSGSVIGEPIPDLTLHILDPYLQPQPIGIPGELFVGGPGLAVGYLNRSELTSERFLADPAKPGERLYRSGDLARLLPDGDIEYLGRIDQQVKIRGFRIELGEIAAALHNHAAVQEAAVLAEKSASTGENTLHAFLTKKIGNAATPSHTQLRDHLASGLPTYMIPSTFTFVEKLPLTTNGKLDRQALLSQKTELAADTFVAASTATEAKLLTLWQEIIGRSDLSASSEFFAVGGTSLTALRLFSTIRRDFGVALPLGAIFKHPTLNKLASAIDLAVGMQAKAECDSEAFPVTCIQSTTSHPNVFLLHGGDGGAMFYKHLLPEMPALRSLYIIESPTLVDSTQEIAKLSIEDAAKKYLRYVRRVQPQGPYEIAGYSYGGIVAYEMARQLTEAGEEVRKLYLIDTDNPSARFRPYTFRERLAINWRRHGLGGISSRLTEAFKNRFNVDAAAKEARRLMANGQTASDSHIRMLQIRESNADAVQQYTPTPVPIDAVLFRSEETSDKYELTADYGWAGQVRSLAIRNIPGGHLKVFAKPNVQVLAKHLTELWSE